VDGNESIADEALSDRSLGIRSLSKFIEDQTLYEYKKLEKLKNHLVKE
jgi:hypothetical protein